MIFLLVLILLLKVLGLYFIWKSYVPEVYLYGEDKYTIRSGNSYLDFESLQNFNSILWKSDKDKLFVSRCIVSNENIAKSILKGLE